MVGIVGHRGARDLWPENSLDGFRRTRELGVDGVEFDVHLARDGELVVIHDPLLDRTTDANGPVGERTAAELEAVGVPRLEAVLDIFEDSAIELHVEIKTDALGRAYPGLERRLLEALGRRRNRDRAIVTCFVPGILETVRAIEPQQKVLASLDRRSAEMMGGLAAALDRLDAIEGCLVAIEKSLLAAAFEPCHQRLGSARLGVWVANEASEIAHWLGAPIRQITTDRPDIALAQRPHRPLT